MVCVTRTPNCRSLFWACEKRKRTHCEFFLRGQHARVGYGLAKLLLAFLGQTILALSESHPLFSHTTFLESSPAWEGTFPLHFAWFCNEASAFPKLSLGSLRRSVVQRLGGSHAVLMGGTGGLCNYCWGYFNGSY